MFQIFWINYQEHILRATVFQNDTKMHSQESEPMGNPLQHHQFVCT